VTSDIPVPTEADYLDAARAYAALFGPPVEYDATEVARNPLIRAAVDSAYAAGWRAGQVRIRAELGFLGHVAEDEDAPAGKREGLRRFVELMFAVLDDEGVPDA
jgi:hypothetical protein